VTKKKSIGTGASMVITVAAFVIVFAAFYGLDHLVMSIQGLPLNADLTPAQ